MFCNNFLSLFLSVLFALKRFLSSVLFKHLQPCVSWNLELIHVDCGLYLIYVSVCKLDKNKSLEIVCCNSKKKFSLLSYKMRRNPSNANTQQRLESVNCWHFSCR